MLGRKKETTTPIATVTPQATTPTPPPRGIQKERLGKKVWQKRIPTLLGLGVLIVAMVAGVLLFGEGTGVFAPRATPQTTPKNIKITNVTDNSFSVSFLTDESTAGFLKYGDKSNSLDNQVGDERDQISGSVQPYNMHHLTVRGLQPSTIYYFTLGTGSNSSFTNDGEPFQVRTAQQAGAQPAAKTIYGSVTTETGAPAEGAVVYVKHPSAGELSSLVKSSGSWAVYLSNARTPDGSDFAQTSDEDTLLVTVQGPAQTKKAQITTTVAQSQPVETIAYGQTEAQAAALDTARTLTATEETTIPGATQSAAPSDATTDTGTTGAAMLGTTGDPGDDITATDSADLVLIVDIEAAKIATPTVTTTQPKIVGKAKPNVLVTLEVHSETQINQEVTADANGDFELDIAALSENLEPGEHTVTYSYTDPDTGEQITETVTFMVAQTAVAQVDQPYGSGNPYPMPSPSPSPSPSLIPSPSPSPTMEATASAEATEEARVALPATDSAIPVSGSVGTTMALVIGGFFFIIAGAWSFWISSELHKGEIA